MSRLLMHGGEVLTPDGVRRADILVADGLIVEIAPDLEHDADRLDVGGAVVVPAFVDLHAHFREPGQEHKETVATGAAAAAAGGYSAVVAMANTTPPGDAAAIVAAVREAGAKAALCDVFPAGALSMGLAGQRLAPYGELWDAGARLFSDDGNCLADAGLLRNALRTITALGGLVANHAEDAGLARGGHMHEGEVSSRLGLAGLPALAEEVIVARDVAIAEQLGAPLHVPHVSTAGTVEIVRAAKARGVAVTAEVTPHHITFDHGVLDDFDPVWKMYPPLRSPADVAACREGVRDGTIDAIATDHAPHAPEEKDLSFIEAPRGVIGLETAFAASYDALVRTGLLDLAGLVARISSAPARILGLAGHGRPAATGEPANLAVVAERAWTVPAHGASRSRNCPWRGATLPVEVFATVFRGSVVFAREGVAA